MIEFRSVGQTFFPPWMRPRVAAGLLWGWKYIYSFLVMCDILVQFVIEGVRVKWPGYCPSEALPIIGRDRRMVRGLVEDDDSYATRLIGWLQAWLNAGSAYAILGQLRGYLAQLGTLRLVTANGTWWTIEADGTRSRVVTLPAKNWDWDGKSNLWARFWIVLYASDYGWTEEGTWGDGTVWGDDGHGIGSTVPWRVVQDVRGIISEWKSAHSVCVNVILSFDDTAFDPSGPPGPPLPDGTWGDDYRIVGGVAVPPPRNPSAQYWSGVA